MPEPVTDNTISIIESAVETAGLSDNAENVDVVDTSAERVDDTTDTTTSEVADATTVVADKSDTKVVDDKKVETKDERDDVDKLLEAEGFKGGKDNRIPYSRTKKIISNALKAREKAHGEVVVGLEAKVKNYETTLETHNRADKLFATDPDRAIQMLAAMHPGKYDKFLSGGKVSSEGDKKPTVAAKDDSPKPQPDVKFEDGTVGYSPEQHDKLLEWNTQKAVREAVAATKAEYDKRFGPIEEGYKSSQSQNQYLNSVRATIAEAKEDYGAEFYTTHEPAILEAIKENDARSAKGLEAKIPLRRIIDKVLRSKSRVDKDKVRGEVMDEITARSKERDKASDKVEAKSTKAVRDPNETRDTEDIIREAVAAAGLK